MYTLFGAVSMVLALAGCEDSNSPLADEQEYQLTVHPNGVAIERQRQWGVGARGTLNHAHSSGAPAPGSSCPASSARSLSRRRAASS